MNGNLDNYALNVPVRKRLGLSMGLRSEILGYVMELNTHGTEMYMVGPKNQLGLQHSITVYRCIFFNGLSDSHNYLILKINYAILVFWIKGGFMFL